MNPKNRMYSLPYNGTNPAWFMQEVEKRAQEVISSMIGAMGYKGYDIAFRGFQQVIPANHHQLENKHMENME